MAWNMNYPDYNSMGVGNPSQAAPPQAPQGQGASVLGGLMGAGGAAAANPYLGAAGVALSAYGSYEAAENAQKQYELMVKQWQAEQDRQARQDEQQQQQQYFTNALSSAQYGQGVKKDAGSQYGTYAKNYGL